MLRHNGIACAYMDSVPVLLLTAQVALQAFGKGAAQESSPQAVDIVGLYKPVTKASLMLLSADKMSETVRFALRNALSGRPGPVHLNLPADLVKRQVAADFLPPHRYRPCARGFDRGAVKEACRLLARAQKPAILIGHGVYLARAWAEVRRLAERLRAPVATTPKGKGLFPEDHLLSLGVLGFAGCPQAEAALLSDEVDVLMAVGTSLGELATHTWTEKLRPREALIQVDIDPREIGKNYPADVAVVGDAKTILTEILFQLDREFRWKEAGKQAANGERWIGEVKSRTPRYVRAEGFEDLSVPLKPQRLIWELREALPADSLLFVDIGNVMAWALHFLPVFEPGTFHINLGLASMGHAVAGSVGGKLAAPSRNVVALVGDGAFAMNGMEVHTAVEQQIPVVWVVMNNAGHGMVCHGERLQFKGKFSTGRFRCPLDVAAMAEAMGALGFRVERPGELARTLREALASGRPAVIDARIDPEEMPPLALRIETLDRFFEGNR